MEEYRQLGLSLTAAAAHMTIRCSSPARGLPHGHRSMRISCFAVLVVLLLSACGTPQTADDFNKTPEARFLNSIVDRLIAHDFASIESQVDPRMAEPNLRGALERTASFLPAEKPTFIDPVDWRYVRSSNGPRTAIVVAQYTYLPARWLVVSAMLTGEPGSFRILRFSVQPAAGRLSVVNAFTFKNKTPLHYAFLFLTVAALAFTAFAFVQCLRTPRLHRKWLWAFFSLWGAFAFTLNWSSGEVHITPLSFNLFSAAYARAGWVGPWDLTFCIPVGAIALLLKRRKLLRAPLHVGPSGQSSTAQSNE